MTKVEKKTVLVLGGTSEANALAEALAGRPDLRVVLSLAGRTASPRVPAVEVRSGGFGGVPGLARSLTESHVDLLIDATHPFAARISANAVAAAGQVGLPRLALRRAAWRQEEGDRWILAATMSEAAGRLEDMGSRVFLTVGRQELAPFAGLEGHWFLVRLVEEPREALPLSSHTVIVGRGAFDRASERELLEAHRIDVVVSKNSGGMATYAKLQAARELGLPVVMIERPPAPPGPLVETVEAAVDWVADQVRLGRSRWTCEGS